MIVMHYIVQMDQHFYCCFRQFISGLSTPSLSFSL